MGTEANGSFPVIATGSVFWATASQHNQDKKISRAW